MSEKGKPGQDERGLTARQLVMLFLGIVTVCAVFFAAGFLVGYNERTSKDTPLTERLAPSSAIPPTVNPPLTSAQPAGQETTGTAAASGPAGGPKEAVQTEGQPSAPSEAEPASTSAAAGGGPGEGFVIQVAASGTEQDADKVVKMLKARGYPAFLVPADKASVNDNLYRVQVGPYPTRDEAEKIRPKLVQEGFKQPFVKH